MKTRAAKFFQALVDPVSYEAMRATSQKVAQHIVAQLGASGMAQHENTKAENAQTGVLIALLKLTKSGVNPMLFVEGQPGFQLLVGSSISHLDYPHVELAARVESDLLEHVRAKKELLKIQPPQAAAIGG